MYKPKPKKTDAKPSEMAKRKASKAKKAKKK
jgi:hypothetical protein